MKQGKRKLFGSDLLGAQTRAIVVGIGIAVSAGVSGVSGDAEAAAPITEKVLETNVPARPTAIVLMPAAANGEQVAYHMSHQSHYSHQSHESHHSHYSGRGW